MEAAIDGLTAGLPELRNFILPGGTETAARLHLARAVCRRDLPPTRPASPTMSWSRSTGGSR